MKTVYGQLKNRILKNRERLSAPEYRVPKIFLASGNWPGDWTGRTMLALASLYKAVNDETVKRGVYAQLEEILNALGSETNSGGYFGKLYDENAVNEQQISGNSWFLRGLCAAYEINGRKDILERLNLIAESYLCKLSASYLRYPMVKREEGDVDGHLQETVSDGWLLSSDVGCAFILLDGITHAYQITGKISLEPVIRTMIEKFAAIDYVFYNCQTHATLSGTRGVLRFYKLTGEKKYLDLAIRNFDVYLQCGITLNYANFNWFGKPYWTEPCAIVDSIMVAEQLFALTGERKYAEFINRCYLNAFLPSLRPNGGAGCDTCLYEGNDCLENHLYEAFFCCSMRIAEGFYELIEYGVVKRENGFYVLLPLDIDCEELHMRVEEHERGRKITITAHEKISRLSIYVPIRSKVRCVRGVMKGGTLEFENFSGTEQIEIEFARYTERRQSKIVHMQGDYILVRRSREEGMPRARLKNIASLPDRNAVETFRQYL